MVIPLLLAGCQLSHQLEEKLLVRFFFVFGLSLVDFRCKPVSSLIFCIAEKIKVKRTISIQYERVDLFVCCPDHNGPCNTLTLLFYRFNLNFFDIGNYRVDRSDRAYQDNHLLSASDRKSRFLADDTTAGKNLRVKAD